MIQFQIAIVVISTIIDPCRSFFFNANITDDRHNVDLNARNSSNPPNIPLFTFRPTLSPSSKPTKRPTRKPSLRPSRKPSPKPTKYPSRKPTALPSQHPTGKPTTTLRPSVAPSVNQCETSTGTIGEQTVNQITVVYNYQMELIKGVNPSDVLPYLEVAVTNTLVKSLYRNCNKRVLQHQVVQRQLGSSVKLAGISSYPPDIDISSLQGLCQSASNENNCFPIKGGVTLYFSFTNRRRLQTNVQSTIVVSTNAIESVMNDGSLNAVHPAIVSLKYLNDGTSTLQIAPQAKGNDGKAYPLTIAFIAIGTILFVILAVFSARYLSRKRKSSHKELYELSEEENIITQNERNEYYGLSGFTPVYNHSDITLSSSSDSILYNRMTSSIRMLESKDGSMNVELVSTRTSDNSYRKDKRSVSPTIINFTSSPSFDFSPILNSKSAEFIREDNYDL